jgi:hypothetical protein
MSEQDPVGSVSTREPEGKKKGLWWLWLLLALLVLAAIAAFLIARNGGDDDPEGVGVSGQQCPDYAGSEGKDETPEIASDPSPFYGCQVAVAAKVGAMLGTDAARLDNGIVIVKSDGATNWDVAVGQLVGVTGTMEEKLDSNDPALASVNGTPYIDVDEAAPPAD